MQPNNMIYTLPDGTPTTFEMTSRIEGDQLVATVAFVPLELIEQHKGEDGRVMNVYRLPSTGKEGV